MTTVTLEIPEKIKKSFGIGKTISYDNLIIKMFGDDCISPDLQFISYDNLSKGDKKMYDEVDSLDKSKFTNI